MPHLTLVEFAGMVGAGKTTVSGGVMDRLRTEGYDAIRLEEAVSRYARRRVTARLARAVFGPRGEVFACRTHLLMAFGNFMLTHPRLVQRAIRSQIGLPIPVWHRLIILRLFFRIASRTRFVTRKATGGEVVIIEEGLIHRTINLYSWTDGAIDRRAVTGYLRDTPLTGVVVFVEAPSDVVTARIAERGLPRRLESTDRATMGAFLERAASIARLARDHLLDHPGHSLVIQNDGSVDAAVEAVIEGLKPLLGGSDRPRTGDAPVLSGTTPLRIPRPDRRSGTRRPVRSDALDPVLAAYGLTPKGPIRPTVGPGRSWTGVVPTHEAGDVFVKRYKDTVTSEATTGEHRVLEFLEERRHPAPVLIRSRDGDTITRVADARYALFEYLDGYFRFHEYLWSPHQVDRFTRLSARALASLHLVLRGFPFDLTSRYGVGPSGGHRVRGADWARLTVERCRGSARGQTGELAAMLTAHGDEVVRRLEVLEGTLDGVQLTPGTIHGDYGPYNLLFRWGHPVIVVDYELVRLDWLVTDVAKALGQFGRSRFGFRHWRLQAFVQTYARHGPVSSDELRHLPTVWEFLTLRRAVACWEHFADTGERHRLTEATNKVGLAGSIAHSTGALARLYAT